MPDPTMEGHGQQRRGAEGKPFLKLSTLPSTPQYFPSIHFSTPPHLTNPDILNHHSEIFIPT
jgi:hypothetical protein